MYPNLRLELADLTWPEVARLDPSRSVVFILSGPIEQHGPHLPLATDLIQARAVMERVLQRVGAAGFTAIVAPPLPYTTAVLSREYPGSTSIRRSHAEAFFADLLGSFAANGLRNIVVTSQHVDPPHVLAWEAACEHAAAEHGARAIEGYERLILDDLASGHFREMLAAGDSHAGAFETSVVMRLRPELVDEALRAALPPQPAGFAELRGARSFREVGSGEGYTGNPAQASEELGELLLERYAGGFGDLVLRHLAGEDVRSQLSVRGHFGDAWRREPGP